MSSNPKCRCSLFKKKHDSILAFKSRNHQSNLQMLKLAKVTVNIFEAYEDRFNISHTKLNDQIHFVFLFYQVFTVTI